MGTHLIFEGATRACAELFPYARLKMAELRALPGEAKQKVIALGRGNWIRLRHDKLQDFIHIKAALMDGYEFFTMVDNPTIGAVDDSTYLHQVCGFDQDINGNLGKVIGRDYNGNPVDPAQVAGTPKSWMLTPSITTGTQPDRVSRDTHYISFDPTTRKVSQCMTITNRCGRRHYNQPFVDCLGLSYFDFYGSPVHRRSLNTYPKGIPSIGFVAGGMLLNKVFIMPRWDTSQGIFDFVSQPDNTQGASLQVTLPSWVTTNSGKEISWIPSPNNDRMAAIAHHYETDADNYRKIYQGWVELAFTAGVTASGALDGSQNIFVLRHLAAPGEHERFAAVGYSMTSQTNLECVRFRAYLSDAWLAKTGGSNPDSEGTEQDCRALAIYAEWFKINSGGTPQTPTRTVLMFHGPLMGRLPTPGSPGPDDYSDENGDYFNLWDVGYRSEAFEEAYGYPYYEANLLALDLRADAYVLQRFMPDAAQEITGRWQTEHACYGETPVVVDSGTNFTEPTIDLVNDYTELTASHGAWQRYLVQYPDPAIVAPDGHKPFDWYIAMLWAPDVAGLGPTSQHREHSFGGFAVHPNGSWSIYLPNSPCYFQSVKATLVSQIYPPASMTIDAVHVKKWDSIGMQATPMFSTTHLAIHNDIRNDTHAYGDETTIQQLMGSATWGLDPEEYANGK